MFYKAEDLFSLSGSVSFFIKSEGHERPVSPVKRYLRKQRPDSRERRRATNRQLRFCKRHGIVPPWDNFECERVIRFVKYGNDLPLYHWGEAKTPQGRIAYLHAMQKEYINRNTEHPEGGVTQFLFFDCKIDPYCVSVIGLITRPEINLVDVYYALHVAVVWEDETMSGSVSFMVQPSQRRLNLTSGRLPNSETHKGPYR